MLGTNNTYTGTVPTRSSNHTVSPPTVATEKTGASGTFSVAAGVGCVEVVSVGVAGEVCDGCEPTSDFSTPVERPSVAVLGAGNSSPPEQAANTATSITASADVSNFLVEKDT